MGGFPDFSEAAMAHLDALYSTARRLTRSPAEAEDLVQDTYVKAFRSWTQFTPGTSLRAWLFTILHNTFLNDLRKRQGSPVEVDETAARAAAAVQPSPGASPEDLLLARATAAELGAALDALPVAYREAVWLRDVQEMSYADIAGVLGVPIGTVMSRIARGRRLLHDRIVESGTAAIRTAAAGVKAKGS